MPFNISLNDLRGLFPVPSTARPLLPLSIKASTASCNIRFSFLIIISGAPNSSNLFNLLFRFITLLYKSFKSEVAKRPPSNCTIGLKSGGITGIISNTIHSGLQLDLRNASTICNLLIIFLVFWPVVFFNSSRSSRVNLSKVNSFNNSLIASAPIPALNSGS